MTDQNITIDTQKTKTNLLKVLIKLNSFYTKLNQELTLFWRRIIPVDSTGLLGWFFKFIRSLLDNPATGLAVNTILLSGAATMAKLFLSSQIIGLIHYVIALNIIVFCVNILGWKERLEKK